GSRRSGVSEAGARDSVGRSKLEIRSARAPTAADLIISNSRRPAQVEATIRRFSILGCPNTWRFRHLRKSMRFTFAFRKYGFHFSSVGVLALSFGSLLQAQQAPQPITAQPPAKIHVAANFV